MLFAFWRGKRGKRLRAIEPQLKASGKYELATLQLTEDDTLAAIRARRLTKEAVSLNASLGDPANAAPRRARR